MLSSFFQSLLISFYCLNPLELAVLGTYSTLIFCFLLRTYGTRQWLRPCLLMLLTLWAAAVIYITLLNREGNGSFQHNWSLFHSYREAFSADLPEILRSSMMNVALFFPCGLLIAGLYSGRNSTPRKMCVLISTSFLFSLGIELCQYHFTLGIGEIDDVMHNTLGAALGFLVFQLADVTFRIRALQKDTSA